MKSMRRQLTWWLVTTTILLVVCASAALYIYVRLALLKEFDAGLLAKAQGLAALLRIERDGKYGLDLTDQSMPEYLPSHKPDFFQISVDGLMFERSASLKNGTLFIPPDAGAQHRAWNLILPNNRTGRAMAMLTKPGVEEEDKTAITKLATNAPPALIVVARDRVELNRILNTLLSSLIVATLVLAIACFVAVQMIVSRGLRPVNRLATQASAIGPDTLSYRFQPNELPAELKPISTRLNDLLERLDNAFQRQRRLNNDIAHELRTPITELRTLTEVAARWPGDQTTTAAYFRDAHDIALKMESLIEMLLTLARTQAQPISITNEQINLAEAIRTAQQSYDSEIHRKNLNLSCTISHAQIICTDKLVFTRILQNLLANAVEYTPENGSIEIVAEQIDGACVLKISNTNDSIAVEDLPRLFESFWRKDAARSDGRHTGLGLTLVSEYAKHLHIKIEPRLPTPDRFEISLRLPVSPAGHLPVMLAADNPLSRRRESDADVAHT